jgi:hypothetical protein
MRWPSPPIEVNAFVCGCGHTGTTIVARILGAHPDVFCPSFETKIFLGEPDKALRQFRRISLIAINRGKRALIEKTPRHLHRISLIRKLVHGAKFIVTVRDGRDVAASFIKRMGNADIGIQRWLTEAALSIVERQRPDVMLVRYEDLISDPKSTIERSCDFIGLRFDPAMLDYHKRPVLWFKQSEIRPGSGCNGPEHDALRNWQVNQPIFDGRGGWQGRLSSEQIALFETGPGLPLMRALGYL